MKLGFFKNKPQTPPHTASNEVEQPSWGHYSRYPSLVFLYHSDLYSRRKNHFVREGHVMLSCHVTFPSRFSLCLQRTPRGLGHHGLSSCPQVSVSLNSQRKRSLCSCACGVYTILIIACSGTISSLRFDCSPKKRWEILWDFILLYVLASRIGLFVSLLNV